MYKDKEQQKKYQREQMKRRRQGITSGITKEEGITEYPAILKALTDPKKRAMLEYVSEDLHKKGLGSLVWYGIGGPDFEMVAELLEVTR